MIQALQGYKTYFLAVVAILVGLGYYAGIIPEEVANPIFALTLPLMGVTLKAGHNRIEEKLNK